MDSKILKQCADKFQAARQDLIGGAELLYQISTEELYKGKYDSFGDYVEEECKISRSMASKLVNTYGYFVLKAGVSPRNLADVDHEKLYLAMGLPGSPMKQLASARELSRSEIRQELKDPEDKCLHEHTYTICSACHKRLK